MNKNKNNNHNDSNDIKFRKAEIALRQWRKGLKTPMPLPVVVGMRSQRSEDFALRFHEYTLPKGDEERR